MTHTALCQTATQTLSLVPIVHKHFKSTSERFSSEQQNWVKVNRFKASSGTFCLLPSIQGNVQKVLVGLEDEDDFWAFGALARSLPEGVYVIDAKDFSPEQLTRFCLAWGLGAYQFDRYKSQTRRPAQLLVPKQIDFVRLTHLIESFSLARDLINTPAEDLRPSSYAEIVKGIAKTCGAKCEIVSGKKLEKEFPAVYAVGRAGEQQPCLVDLHWGDAAHPKLTLVGKGVCFDSGGLDIKPAAGMREMKKDMGGSAIMLAFAQFIMQQKLPICLRLILPLAENAIAGNSTRPGDVITMRSGKTVEIGNTDAEGRLILADALTLACEDAPDYLIDIATLTGAARVAAGPDIPVMIAADESLAQQLMEASAQVFDCLCRLPLYQPYKKFLKSKIADLCNISSVPYGGAITAALFLQEFVLDGIAWVHFDVNAWNTRHLPGRPQGGEASGLLALVQWVENFSR